MRNVTVSFKGQGVQGLTVGKREKTNETAVLFTVNGTDVVEWYPSNAIQEG